MNSFKFINLALAIRHKPKTVTAPRIALPPLFADLYPYSHAPCKQCHRGFD